MKENIIILTTGSSGSSVLAGIISKKGYWLGEETKKLDFDTYENEELVNLDIEILKLIGFKRTDCNDIPPPSIEKIRDLTNQTDLKPFQNFIDKCNQNNPWLWKDPRLSFTIHFWVKLIPDIIKNKYIFIDRDPYQSYAGLILSRKIPMSFEQQSLMNHNYVQSCNLFFKEKKISYFHCYFEELIFEPEAFINRLNSYLNTNIDINDVKAIYKGKLFKKRYNDLSFLQANIRYFLYRYIKRDFITFPRNDL